MHSQKYSQIRKEPFKHACRNAADTAGFLPSSGPPSQCLQPLRNRNRRCTSAHTARLPLCLHMHVANMHRKLVQRFIPSEFRRELHAKDGMPTCTACHKEFKQWKRLRDHILRLPGADQTKGHHAVIGATVQPPGRQILQQLKKPSSGVAHGGWSSCPNHRCTISTTRMRPLRMFSTPDHTQVKSHICQAHPKDWQ